MKTLLLSTSLALFAAACTADDGQRTGARGESAQPGRDAECVVKFDRHTLEIQPIPNGAVILLR